MALAAVAFVKLNQTLSSVLTWLAVARVVNRAVCHVVARQAITFKTVGGNVGTVASILTRTRAAQVLILASWPVPVIRTVTRVVGFVLCYSVVVDIEALTETMLSTRQAQTHVVVEAVCTKVAIDAVTVV